MDTVLTTAMHPLETIKTLYSYINPKHKKAAVQECIAAFFHEIQNSDTTREPSKPLMETA